MKLKSSINLKIAIVYAMALFVLMADRLFKTIARHYPDKDINLWPWLNFNYHANTGIAFSLPGLPLVMPLFIGLIILALGYASLLYYKKKQASTGLLLSLMAAGALSNLADRLLYGAVIDYLDVRLFICNLADVLISLATALLIIALVFKTEKSTNGLRAGAQK
jgi:signal peptidase II